jgi:hypothetical protein
MPPWPSECRTLLLPGGEGAEGTSRAVSILLIAIWQEGEHMQRIAPPCERRFMVDLRRSQAFGKPRDEPLSL